MASLGYSFFPHGHLSLKAQNIECVFDVCVLGGPYLCQIFNGRIGYWRHVLQFAGMALIGNLTSKIRL